MRKDGSRFWCKANVTALYNEAKQLHAFARVMHSPECRMDRLLGRVAAWFNPFFQIESLYRFNAKFSPRWEPRYLVYEGAAGLARAGLAAMRAEGQLHRPRLHR